MDGLMDMDKKLSPLYVVNTSDEELSHTLYTYACIGFLVLTVFGLNIKGLSIG